MTASPAPSSAGSPGEAKPGGATPGAAHSSSPESLDGIIATTNPRGWWALWAIAGVVVAVLIWSIVATIPQQKTASGVVNSYAYAHEVTATTAGIFNGTDSTMASTGAMLRNLKQDEQVGTITPYDGSPVVPVLAPVTGQVTAIYVSEGEGVEPGTPIGSMNASVAGESELAISAWVPLSTAFILTEGEQAAVTISDVATGDTNTVTATIQAIADTPSTVMGMATLIGDPDLAQQWSAEAGGQPYRIDLTLDMSTWPSSSPLPAPGAIVSIVATYAEVHPIEILFGGAS